MATTLAVPFLVGSAILTFCRVFTPSSRLLVMATAFVPFALVGYLVAAAICAFGWRLSTGWPRRTALAGLLVSLLGASFHGALLVPAYAGKHASGRPDLTVLTSNLRLGQADPAGVERLVQTSHADVVVLQEVTPTEVTAILGLRRSHPYVAGGAAPGAFGTVVFSRWPLRAISQLPVSKGGWEMQVQAPRPFTLVAVHTSQPLVDYPKWSADHHVLNTTLERLRGPVVAAGDFNATLDHAPMRDLLAAGYSDAARQANEGWQPTWPSSHNADGSLPLGLSVLTLDHVLVSRQFSAVSTSTYRVSGSDHRALLARLAAR